MLMVSNVGVNRTRSGCLDFKDIRTVFQSPGGFETTPKSYFYQGARQQNIDLARKVLRGGRCHPASNALGFLSQPTDALPSGLTSRIQADINPTAFLVRFVLFVHLFTK